MSGNINRLYLSIFLYKWQASCMYTKFTGFIWKR
jgi:hypothetical protein